MTEEVVTKAVYTTDAQPPLYYVAGYRTTEPQARGVDSIQMGDRGVVVRDGLSALLIPWHRVARVEGLIDEKETP